MLSIKGMSKYLLLKDFDLKKGEFCIVLGNNVSGKSCLLKTITGEYKFGGKICLGDKEISKLPPHERANMISTVERDILVDDDIFIKEMTLFENLVISYLRSKTPSFSFYSNYSSKMHNILSELGLGLVKYLHSPIEVLSLEQRQIIAILMAIMSDTKLLVLNECLGYIAPKVKSLFMGYITKKIEVSKTTTLMITDNFTDAIEYGDRLVILHRGMIASDIRGNEKLSLTKDHLLRLFHSITDEERY